MLRATKGFGLILLTIVVISYPALAQNEKDASEILKKVGEAYTALTSYHFEGVEIEESRGEERGVKTEAKLQKPMFISAARPDKFRFEIRGRTLNAMFVSNGQTIWAYFFGENRYIKKAISKDDDKSADKDELDVGKLAAAAEELLSKFKSLASDGKTARLLREEALEVAGKPVDCYVVQIDDRPPTETSSSSRTLWIDKSRFIVLRQVRASRSATTAGDFTEMKVTTIFNVAKTNEPLANELFAFNPPQGAREITGNADDSPFIGQPAVEFTLKDTQGKSVGLKELAGKVVLINFWATWCGPCRVEMPALEKLYRQYKAQGLAVFGINNEDAGVADAYLKKNGFTFPTLLDPDSALLQKYRVEGLPTTVVIDRDGKVVAHFVGTRSEQAFRAAIAKAGIK